jgi:hypothetical protein
VKQIVKKCTVKACHRPAFVDCDSCCGHCCALHSKGCEDCGKSYCNAVDMLCYAKHECCPPAEHLHPETLFERVERIARLH